MSRGTTGGGSAPNTRPNSPPCSPRAASATTSTAPRGRVWSPPTSPPWGATPTRCAATNGFSARRERGALFVRREALDEVKLSWAGAHSHREMDYRGHYTLLPSAARYEFGTRALADFHGFGRAVRWLEETGFERIFARIEELVGYAIGKVRETGALALASPPDPADRSGILVVRLPAGCDPFRLYRELGEDRRDPRLAGARGAGFPPLHPLLQHPRGDRRRAGSHRFAVRVTAVSLPGTAERSFPEVTKPGGKPAATPAGKSGPQTRSRGGLLLRRMPALLHLDPSLRRGR